MTFSSFWARLLCTNNLCAAEIRLEIYKYLLQPYQRERCSLPHPFRFVPLNYRLPMIHVFKDHIYGRVGPPSLTFTRDTTECRDYQIWPAILATCQIARREALPCLSRYVLHRFHFTLEYDKKHQSLLNEDEVKYFCSRVFAYKDRDWEMGRVPLPLMNSPFAIFLAKIGPENAGMVSHLCFLSGGGDAVTDLTPLVTELVTRYMPGLREIEFHIHDGLFDNRHRLRKGGYGVGPVFEPMFQVLEDFVDRTHWLRRFDHFGLHPFRRSEYEKLRRLEKRVSDRSK